MIKKYINNNKEELKKCVEDLKHKDTFYKQIPNLLTILRLIGGIPAGIIYNLNPQLSIITIAFLWFTDAIDGKIAKKLNIQSQIGADMDAFADKIMFLGSALPLLANAQGLITNFVLEGVISAINVTGRMKGLDTKTVLSGKFKTVFLALTLISGYFVQFLNLPVFIFNVMKCTTTAFQFLAIKDYILAFNKMYKEQKNNNSAEEIKNDNYISEDKEEEKELTVDVTKNKLKELRKEKEFLLSTKEPEKVYRVNKRTRNIFNEKKNNNYHNS